GYAKRPARYIPMGVDVELVSAPDRASGEAPLRELGWEALGPPPWWATWGRFVPEKGVAPADGGTGEADHALAPPSSLAAAPWRAHCATGPR
ncbi:hypothetical protein ACLESO_60060, partial [Pyxidicoccus sp. 3LG]